MRRDDLSSKQLEVVESDARRLVVLGGAGSGKTTVALIAAHEQLERSSVDGAQVLFLTFSKAAVRELASRAQAMLGVLERRVEVHTFHAFAHWLICSFGRYVGLGSRSPSIQSEAEQKLLGRDSARLTYADLLPNALAILKHPLLRALFARRWCLIICDEFQDTDDVQWRLLNELSKNARLALFADPNQMIYTFLPGVGAQRLADARESADEVVDLGAPSFRDPSQVIPAAAEAVRKRDFSCEAIRYAIDCGRLKVHKSVPDKGLARKLCKYVREMRHDGAKSVAIFAHSNFVVAALSAALLREGLEHTLVGLPEAQGEAFAAMEQLLRLGLGDCAADVAEEGMAVFLTSASRGRSAPELAQALVGKCPMDQALTANLDGLYARLRVAAKIGVPDVVREVAVAWDSLGVSAGRGPWKRAAGTFSARAALMYAEAREDREEFLNRLGQGVAELRGEALVGSEIGKSLPVQLMNFHQTKGRQADAVLLVYRDGDFFGRAAEPFVEASRLLYVSLTRAHQKNVVVLPEHPHPLVAPFESLA